MKVHVQLISIAAIKIRTSDFKLWSSNANFSTLTGLYFAEFKLRLTQWFSRQKILLRLKFRAAYTWTSTRKVSLGKFDKNKYWKMVKRHLGCRVNLFCDLYSDCTLCFVNVGAFFSGGWSEFCFKDFLGATVCISALVFWPHIFWKLLYWGMGLAWTP